MQSDKRQSSFSSQDQHHALRKMGQYHFLNVVGFSTNTIRILASLVITIKILGSRPNTIGDGTSEICRWVIYPTEAGTENQWNKGTLRLY